MPQNKYWSEEDIQFLHNNAGYLNHEELGRHLGRTATAVEVKQARLRIRFMDNVYTATLLSEEIGKARSVIRKWCKRGWLKCKRGNWSTAFGSNPILFREEDIVSFLREYKHLFNYHKIVNPYFRNIVKEAQENDAFKEERKTYYTVTKLGQAIGRSRSVIMRWCKRGWIKFKKAEWVSELGNKPIIFKEEDIVEFLREHYKLFDYRKVPNKYFSNIIKGEK